MADTSLVALKAVIARLKGYASLTGISSKIYTDIPQNCSPPYVLVEIDSVPWTQNDGSHMMHLIKIHGFSRKPSPFEAMEITQEAFNALDRKENSLSLDSGNAVLLRFSGLKDNFKEHDGKTWHSLIEFELTIN